MYMNVPYSSGIQVAQRINLANSPNGVHHKQRRSRVGLRHASTNALRNPLLVALTIKLFTILLQRTPFMT
jgi:hypothetical protein